MVLRLGFRYFALVFAAGMVLGTVRTLWIEPRLGPLVAVALELPVMLGLSVLACRGMLRGRAVGLAAAAAMGAVALVLLLLAEAAVSISLGGLTLAGHLALYRQPGPLLGLAGQLVFAALPMVLRQKPRPAGG